MQNAIFKLEVRFEFGEAVEFNPFTDLSAEYSIGDFDEEEGLPPAFEIDTIDYEKIAESPPELEKWTDEESLLHGIFGRTEQILISQDWKVLCKLSLPLDCDLRLVGIFFHPKQGTAIEPTFKYEIENQSIL